MRAVPVFRGQGTTQDQLSEALQADRHLEALWAPNPGTQVAFLASTVREVLFGGAVGGGKTEALTMAPLRWVGHPQHRGILLRRERSDLQEIIDRMREIYPQVVPGARWVESRLRFEFPTGAFISAGHAERDVDIQKFKSFEFNFVGFDELTLWLRSQYVYMISRNRSKRNALPLQLRSGTNPDGEGHQWVYERLVENREPYRIYRQTNLVTEPGTGKTRPVTMTQQFIPSTVFDNPSLANRDEYIGGLMAMGRHTADALLYGKWDFFRGQMFPYGPTGGLQEVDPGPKGHHYVVRCLDYGWTDPTVVYWLVVYPGYGPGQPGPVVEIADELHVVETAIPGLAHLIRSREAALERDWGLRMPVLQSVADPSVKRSEPTSQGRSVYDLFLQHGVWFERANNDRQAGWAQTRLMLEAGLVRPWRGRAPYLLSTLPKLVRDTQKAEDIKDRQDDHGADTLRYGLMAVRDTPLSPEPEPDRLDPRRDYAFDRIVGALRRSGDPSNFGGGPSGLPGF